MKGEMNKERIEIKEKAIPYTEKEKRPYVRIPSMKE
jgi:hypothetical protein